MSVDPQSSIDRRYLDAVIELAERGRFSAAPNPCVGALVCKAGQVLGRGWHERPGGAHAEIAALEDARRSLAEAGHSDSEIASRIEGSTVYVTLEPCSFHGRTPPCAEALVAARVGRVVGALTDPHPKVAGQGYARLRAAGIAVTCFELPEARALIAGYLSRVERKRPFVRLKIASAIDGRTAMASGESQWITSPAARADVQYWRARSDAILTGSGTVLADDPQMTVRDARFAVSGSIRQPLRVVLDREGRVPADAKVFAPPEQSLWVRGPEAQGHRGTVPALTASLNDTGVDLGWLLETLAERGCNEVLVEAGPTLIGAFLRAALWDEAVLYLAPRWLGSRARPQAELGLDHMAEAIDATIVDCTMIERDLRLTLRPEPAATRG